MLQYQVSDQFTSLRIKDTASPNYPVFTQIDELKLGFSTFWRSPYYNTTSRKRELPTVRPSTSTICQENQPPVIWRSSQPEVKSILKKSKIEDTKYPIDRPFRKRLRRNASFSTNTSNPRPTKRVQFEIVNDVEQNDSQEIYTSRPCSRLSGISNTVSMVEYQETKTPPRTPDSGMINRRPYTACAGTVSGSVSYMCKSDLTHKDISMSINTDTPDVSSQRTPSFVSTQTFKVRPRPESFIGLRGSISNHVNYCNKEKTIRILKWLTDVDRIQTSEGKCTDLVYSIGEENSYS